MAEVLKCGHNKGFLYSIRDVDNVVKRFCMGCLLEKIELKDINGFVPANIYKNEKVKELKKESKENIKAKCTVCGGTNVHHKKGCLDCFENHKSDGL